MEKKIEQKVAESQKSIDKQVEDCVETKREQKPISNSNKKSLTPYQKYKQSKNKNGKKYFDFYNDIKVYTHNIYDW